MTKKENKVNTLLVDVRLSFNNILGKSCVDITNVYSKKIYVYITRENRQKFERFRS